ncbi:hypothetical protein RSAG8_09623, partial [Rhizoctonia solani AG-8 WAC10335]
MIESATVNSGFWDFTSGYAFPSHGRSAGSKDDSCSTASEIKRSPKKGLEIAYSKGGRLATPLWLFTLQPGLLTCSVRKQ